MLFTEFRFLIFFVLVFSVYWSLNNNTHRKVLLLVSSYLFYSAWDARFLTLILISTIVDYIVGFQLDSNRSIKHRRIWLFISLLVNLGILAYFKYCNFFIESAVTFLNWLGINAHYSTLEIILPVGISFYTFQTLSYSLDIYRGNLKHTNKLLDFALFVGFFPQLVAGPIVRAKNFLPQLKILHVFNKIEFRAYLILFLIGFFKKAVISDNAAPYVDLYFDNPAIYDGLSGMVAIILYSIQIYCDFSGYSDMAIAVAGLLGYQLCLNFNSPYLASNITDFWRRWHISLSTWLRDYLYIALGGNKGTKWFIYRNLMLTMLIGGLWHGASWNFVVWGGLHGIALILHKEWRKYFISETCRNNYVYKMLCIILTYYWICLTWIFFRAKNFEDAILSLKHWLFLNFDGDKSLPIDISILFVIVLSMGLVHWLFYRQREIAYEWWKQISIPQFVVIYSIILACILPLIPIGFRPFIYFQF